MLNHSGLVITQNGLEYAKHQARKYLTTLFDVLLNIHFATSLLSSSLTNT